MDHVLLERAKAYLSCTQLQPLMKPLVSLENEDIGNDIEGIGGCENFKEREKPEEGGRLMGDSGRTILLSIKFLDALSLVISF